MGMRLRLRATRPGGRPAPDGPLPSARQCLLVGGTRFFPGPGAFSFAASELALLPLLTPAV